MGSETDHTESRTDPTLRGVKKTAQHHNGSRLTLSSNTKSFTATSSSGCERGRLSGQCSSALTQREELGLSRVATVAVYVLPCVLAVVCYVNGLGGDFVHDDVYAIEMNGDVTGTIPLTQIFLHDFWGKRMDNPRSHKSYRPLTTILFRLDYYLSRGDPRWFHAINILLHACVTALVGLVSRKTLRAPPIVAMLTATHFAVHPIHTEAVTGIVGRADVLAAFFFLASFYFYTRSFKEGTVVAKNGASSSPASPSASPSTPSTPEKDINHNNHPLSSTSSIAARPESPLGAGIQQSLPPSLKRSSSIGQHQPVTTLVQFRYLAASLMLAGVGVGCKETGITVLGAAIAYDVLVHLESWIRCLKSRTMSKDLVPCIFRCCCMIAWGILLLLLRVWIMDFAAPKFRVDDNPAASAPSRITRFLTFSYLPTFNLWLLLCPSTLSYDWAVGSIPLVTSISDSRNVWTLLVFTGLGGLTCLSLRQAGQPKLSKHSHNSLTQSVEEQESENASSPSFVSAMGLVLMCIPFLPASNLFFPVGFVVAERVLYIPSIGFSLLVAQGVANLSRRLPRPKLTLTLAVVVLLLTLGVRTVRRNQDWLSRDSLFRSGIRTHPHNAKMHYNIANLLRDEGDIRAAELHYREAIRLFPHHPSYHVNLGAVLTNRTEAELCYQSALKIHPSHPGAMVNLAVHWLEDANYSGAIPLLQRALDFDPNHTEALLAMGKALLEQNEAEKAGKMFQRVLHLRPAWGKAHLYYAAFLQMSNNLDSALQEYLQTLQLDPDEGTAMTNAARILISRGKYEQAQPLLDRAIELDPTCSECLSVLASSYTKRGQLTKAVFTLSHAVALAPNDTSIGLKYIQVLIRTGQNRRAKTTLQTLLARMPDDLSALTFAYTYAMEEERLEEASDYIRQAVMEAERVRHSTLSYLYREQGEIYRRFKDYSKALQFYLKSTETDDHNTAAIVSVGSILHLMRRYEEAEIYYLRALEQQPDNQLARENLAKLRKVIASGG